MGDQTTTASKALKNLRKKDYSLTVKEVERRKAQDRSAVNTERLY